MSSETSPTFAPKIVYLAQHPLFRALIQPHLPVGFVPFTAEGEAAVQKALAQTEIPELKELDKIAEEVSFKKGVTLAHQGEYADQLFIVRSGMLETQVETKEHVFWRQTLHLPNAFFDDVWLFAPQVYPFYVKARRDGRLVLIGREKLITLIKSHPRVLQAMFTVLSPEAQRLVLNSRLQDYLGRKRPWYGRVAEAMRFRRMGRAPDATDAHFDHQLARLHDKFQLQPEESIKFQSRRSPWLLVPQLAFPIILLAAMAAVAWLVVGSVGVETLGMWRFVIWGAALVLPLAYLIFNYIDWANDYFLITDRQIIQYEFDLRRFDSKLNKVPVDKVQSIEVETPNIVAKALDLGTARITTAAQSQVIFFDYISNPKDVQTAINKIREQTQNLSAAKVKREMRQTAETHFTVPKPYTTTQYPSTKKSSRVQALWNGVREIAQSYSHRSEKNGVVTYHKHIITLLSAMKGPLLLAFLVVGAWYFLHYFAHISFDNPLGAFLIITLSLVNFGYFIWQFEDWHNDTYQITDRYVIDVDRMPFGLQESRKQAELSKVENVRTEQTGIIATVFNYGRVIVETAGATSSIVFEQVADPRSVQSDLFKRRDKMKSQLEQQAQVQRRMEYAIFMDAYNKTARQNRIPSPQPLLEEGEGDEERHEAQTEHADQ